MEKDNKDEERIRTNKKMKKEKEGEERKRG